MAQVFKVYIFIFRGLVNPHSSECDLLRRIIMANFNISIKGFNFNDSGVNVNLDELNLATEVSAEDMKTSGETLNKAIPVVGNLVKEILAQQNKHDAEQAEARRKSEKELEEMRERNARLNRIDSDAKFQKLENRIGAQERINDNLTKNIDIYAKDVANEIANIKSAVDHVKGIRNKIAGMTDDDKN